ncbi:MAG: flagellar export chaperone FliS [Pseudohongiellaceae bacterium]|nr:flagellar export chaperone FliS [Pseudohongiellaceae bacterium]
MYAAQSALAQYKKINTESGLEGASPHRLIELLFNCAIDRLAQAKGAMQREDIPLKGLMLGKAVSIIGGLQASLDKTHNEELAGNLDALYDYMQRRLLEANLKNDIAMVEEVVALLVPVKEAWEQISPDPTPAPQPSID